SHFFRKYKTSKIDNFQMHSFSIANVFAPWRVQLRNHRKALVIDGKIAFVGGINISSENDINTCNKEKYIHDLHCKLEGPAVIPLQLDFLRDWFYATKTKLSTLLQAEYFPGPKQIGDATVRIISSGPGQQEAATEKVFLAAIATAKEYLLIMTPYFMPDQPIMKALSTASARGVDIRIILPKRNNHWYVQFASRSLYPFLLQNNIRVFEKHGVFSHTKAMVADDNWGQMGSSNWDVRSLRLNYELDFIVEDEGFIFDLKQQFLNELTESEEILLEQVQNKKLARQLVENFCALFTPVL
ncbi:MAG: hypothetical protein KAT71_01095, partial [Gammaproteobacteria bacterium]|nr:hypothetical protein [Gammaproteobacteria bacterium]